MNIKKLIPTINFTPLGNKPRSFVKCNYFWTKIKYNLNCKFFFCNYLQNLIIGNMKRIIFSLFSILSTYSYGQINIVLDTTKRTVEENTITRMNPQIIGGVDTSKTSFSQRSLIMHMERLSDEQFLRLVNKLVVGQIIYKEE